MIQFIGILDYLILPLLLAFIYAFAYGYRNRNYSTNHPYRKYFIPALSLKIAGAIFIGMIYQYYYGGGDTTSYFNHAKIINSSFSESFTKWLQLLLRLPAENDINYFKYTSSMFWYGDAASYSVASFAAFIGIFFKTTYLPTAVMFAVISFTGVWAMFRAFAQIYPQYIKQVAIAVLFMPSAIVWGSGIFKDTLCLAFLGWLTYSVLQILVRKNFSIKNIATAIISIYLVFVIKKYILIAFIPAITLWVLFVYTANIKDASLRAALKFGVMAVMGVGTVFALSYLGEEYLGSYSLDNIAQTSEVTRSWIQYSSGDEGSAYDLGEIGSPLQMLVKSPLAINVTLFRPYLWESRKIIVLLSALESFLFLLLTLKIFFAIGLKKVWATIAKDPTIQFCLIFALIFAFAVGISTYNFGSLSRYKIPCLAFYALAMLLIYYKNVPKGQKLFKLLNI